MTPGNEPFGYVGDLHFLAVSMLKYNMEPMHVAVLTFIHRNRRCEAMDVVADTGMSKSRVFRVLHYLHGTGALRWLSVKHGDRQRVKVWELTDDGRRSVLAMEKLYRQYQARSIRHALVTAGKEVERG